MPTVNDCLAQAKFLIEHGRGEEPATLIMPRVEAQRRRANREKRTRVQFDATEETYRRFHEQLQRYRELAVNVTIAHDLMVDILAAVPDETIHKLIEAGKPTEG
jgi:predicted N-formylglutamate amidohydrolase